MPTYEYQCTNPECGHRFELFQRMTEPVKRKCPECGLLKLRRLIGTGAGVIFKGSGFYQTDYRSDSYRKAAEAEKPSTGEKKKKEGTKAEKRDPDARPSGRSGSSADSVSCSSCTCSQPSSTRT
jgi:putative FmdB family regulatory protein